MEVCVETAVWNDYIWSQMDKAVREEVGRVRVAQKAFRSTRREQMCYRSLSIELYLLEPGYSDPRSRKCK